MSNATSIAEKVRPYLVSSGIHRLYVSTDSCDVLLQLRKPELLGSNGIVLMSPCDRGPSPQRGHPEDTLRLIAEIEMMRHGKDR